MYALRLFFAAALAASFFACKSDAPKTAPDTGAATKPELFLYAANVDNLRLRDKPDQSSGVIAQVKEGAMLEGAGNESTNQEEIELRGIPFRAPYYQVTALSGDKPSGWAFGGALTCVYAGPRKDSPDAARIGAFAEYLKTLNPRDIASGGKAWAYVETELADASRPLADAAFILLERFLRRMHAEGEFYKMTEKVSFTEADGQAIYTDRFKHDKYPETALIAANGFRLVFGEGSIFPVVNWGRFQDYFGPRATSPMQIFINQRTAEQNVQMFDDGGLLIPLEKVADVAVFWEKFNRNNPYFPLGDQSRESERWLRIVLTCGSDNTPVFSGDTMTASQNFRSAWDYIQQTHPNSNLAKLTKQLTDLCAAEGWKRTQKVQDFQNQVMQSQ